jgi:hypothetical protein
MSGRCVRLRGVGVFGLSMVALSGTTLTSRGAFAQPSAGFPPPSEVPSEAQPAPPPPAVTPAPVFPAPSAAPEAQPDPAGPGAPAPAPAPPPPSWLEYGSGLPPPASSVPLEPGMPVVLPYRPGLPIPPGYHAESRPAGGLVATGALTLGISYAAALGLALADSFENGTGWLVVPIAGPWAAAGARRFSCEAETIAQARQCFSGAYDEATTIAVFAVDGVIQAVGVALTIAGLASRTHELVRNDAERLNVTAKARPNGGFDVGVQGVF